MSHLTHKAADLSETISGPSSKGQENDPNVSMAGILSVILQGLQTLLVQLNKSSKLLTQTLQNLREDLILRSDDEEIDNRSGGNNITGGNTLDIESVSAPRLFTKVLKPVFANLRAQGFFCMSHIDDSFLMGHSL